MKYDIKNIASILGQKQKALYPSEISILLTDSRKLSNPLETLFFAITTKNNDAHHFINELYKAGVKNFVVTKVLPEWDQLKEVNFIINDDFENRNTISSFYAAKDILNDNFIISNYN